VQYLELAREAELDWLARLDGCRRGSTHYLGVRSVAECRLHLRRGAPFCAYSLDRGNRPESNTSSGDPSDVGDGEVKAMCEIPIVALVQDSIQQVIVHSGTYAMELLLTATILVRIRYVIVRGLVTRLARRQSAVIRADGRPGNQATPDEDP
jgi:hypothetical protein